MGLLVVSIRPYTVKSTLFWLIYTANSSIGCNICFNSSYFSHFFTKVPVGSLVDCLFLTFLQQNSYCFAVVSYLQTVMGLLVVSIRPFAVNSYLWLLYLQQILEMAAILTSLFQNFVQFLTFLQQNSYCFCCFIIFLYSNVVIGSFYQTFCC